MGAILKSLSAPSAQTIGSSAFYGSFPHTMNVDGSFPHVHLSLPSAITIGFGAFRHNNEGSIASLSLPAVTSIGDEAFWGALGNLKDGTLRLPAIESIGDNAFGDNHKLKAVVLGPSAVSVHKGEHAGHVAHTAHTRAARIEAPSIASLLPSED